MSDFIQVLQEKILETFLNQLLGKKLDAVIIYAGTNDLTNGTNTMKYVRKIAKTIQEMEDSSKMGIAFAGTIESADLRIKLKRLMTS